MLLISPIFEKKFFNPIDSSISKGPIDQLNPSLKASSMSLYSSVIAGTSEDEYNIILDITDQAYLPYLSSLLINSKRLILSIFKSIFLTGEYTFVFKLRASKIFLFSDLFIL